MSYHHGHSTGTNIPPLLPEVASFQLHSNITALKCSPGKVKIRAVYCSSLERSTQSVSCNPWGDHYEDRSLLPAILMLLDSSPCHKSRLATNPLPRQTIHCRNYGCKTNPIVIRHSMSYNTIGTGSHTVPHDHSTTHPRHVVPRLERNWQKVSKLTDYFTIFFHVHHSPNFSVFYLPQQGCTPNLRRNLLNLGSFRLSPRDVEARKRSSAGRNKVSQSTDFWII